jgi:pimeloyl-ACP methyl ester carboxylesterase
MSFTSHYLSLLDREIHLTDWAAQGRGADAPVVVAWHGLARTGRDMDELAQDLSAHGYRVVCPDMLGRGLSQWSPAPDTEYCLAFYARLAEALFDRLGLPSAHWVGTSMGGAIGMVCAGGRVAPSMKSRIRSLVLNDIAPELQASAIERIRSYAGKPPAFDTVLELEAFFRQVYTPYGWLSDAQWRRLTETSTRRLPDGRVTPHYDPAMVQQFVVHPNDYLIWDDYDQIAAPVLFLRGESSDLVSTATRDAMRQRGPGARGQLQCLEIAGCGHAPALNVPAHLDPIREFIRRAT